MTRNSNSVDERVEEKPGVLDGVSLISSLLRDISLIKFPTSIQVLKDNQMAGHGGKREGAGRQKGKPNKITIERQEQVIREKREPLDRMLRAMQIFESLAEYYQPGTTEQPNPNHDEAKYVGYVRDYEGCCRKGCAVCPPSSRLHRPHWAERRRHSDRGDQQRYRQHVRRGPEHP